MSRRETALKYFREHQDYMEERVKSGVELYRKGDAQMTVVDGEGNPLKGVKIAVKQKNHEFKYGANIFMLDEFENEEKNRIYREKFCEIFNLATVPFYWKDLEPEQGKTRYTKDSPRIYRRPAPDLCVEYCLANGIEPKCHCLNYDSVIPEWVCDADVEQYKMLLEKRFREIAERYAKTIPSFEVTNETFRGYKDYQTQFYRENDFVEWSFRTAAKYFPNNRLIINDYVVFDDGHYRENRSQYFMQIERLLRNGIYHLDSVGMQFHSFFDLEREPKDAEFRYNPMHLYQVLDKYAELGKRMQITEMTIPAYSASPEDEEIQAELIHHLYSVFFSHPAMEAIIYWNLPDGYAAYAPQGDMTSGENKYYGGLLRYDLSEKPACWVIKDLFGRKWRTEAEVTTNDVGCTKFRGFYGEYEVTVTGDGKETKTTLMLSSRKNNINKIVMK
ncbi:endo-1,4-beta-xylanase [Ructibacterium gallinarum]|uniref:Endo-1,4-beta-xylanase n=1 Tax=Ructibacterium gallinarum TaxID=2779355 RepID=A0A9D5M806_9FIRM|nr:endo-1,4-beta-xylanase [Ructibacterium gallinarum]MBE5041252.1 endo-1,4-beta-xylanase [Ructibacterium gallinarum]